MTPVANSDELPLKDEQSDENGAETEGVHDDDSKKEASDDAVKEHYDYNQILELLTADSERNPNNVLSGAASGAGVLVTGTLTTAACIVGCPAIGTKMGYSSSGAVGALVGLTAGSLVGTLVGAAVMVTTAVRGLTTMAYGLVRTPGSILATAEGKDWDEMAQEWIYSDLKQDESATLFVSEEQYLAKRKASGSTSAVFSALNAGDTSSNVEGASPEQAGREARDVREHGLYDVLGVDIDATPAQIKKAYYVQARKNHPDRNPNDPTAHERFQKVGEAYVVLADERTRFVYDQQGYKGVKEGAPKVDASMLYGLLFGSEKFEALIGDLQLAQQFKASIEAEQGGGSEVLPFRQRKREVQIAVNLAKKLCTFVEAEGKDEALQKFREETAAEAVELGSSNLGSSLLRVIGTKYMNAARSELSSLDSWWLSIHNSVERSVGFWGSICLGANAMWKLSGMQQFVAKHEEEQMARDKAAGLTEEEVKKRDKENGPMSMQAMYTGDTLSEEDKIKLKEQTKRSVHSLLKVVWGMTKQDINDTLDVSLAKLLHDHSISKSDRIFRAKGLYILGEEYARNTVDDAEGIGELVNQLGIQTGMYGEVPEYHADFSEPSDDGEMTSPNEAASNDEKLNAPYAKATSEEPFDSYDTDEACLKALLRIPEMKPAELKQAIARLHGISIDCIEKQDLQKRLKSLLVHKMSEDSLRTAATQILVDQNIDENCEKDILIEMLSI